MKILQINSVCGAGSTGRITTDLYKTLEDQGHECLIAYGRGKAPKIYHTIRIGSAPGVYLHALYSRITDHSAFASKTATKKFLDKVKEYDPDIIHLHNLHGYYINLELLFQFLKEAKKPVIWSLYDCWSFTGHCCHFDYVGCNKWKSGCHDCSQRKSYPKSIFSDHSENNYLRKKSAITSCSNMIIVPPTKWLTELVKESYLNIFPIVTIPSGIDLEVFKPTKNDLREKYGLEGHYVVLGVSNGFGLHKGLIYLIELSKNLPREYKLVMVGVDSKKNNLPENILVLPRTASKEELAKYYTMADVFVNPTLQETQGLTNIEALACGTGVVTFKSGGSPECIDEDCGIVVERGDLTGFINAVMKACKAPFDSASCIMKANDYDKAKLNLDYIRLYENCGDLLK